MSKPTLGIIGGGQLGKMTAMAAKKMGFSVFLYCPKGDNPAEGRFVPNDGPQGREAPHQRALAPTQPVESCCWRCGKKGLCAAPAPRYRTGSRDPSCQRRRFQAEVLADRTLRPPLHQQSEDEEKYKEPTYEEFKGLDEDWEDFNQDGFKGY